MSVVQEIRYTGDLHCEAVHGPSGVTLWTDAPTDNGGKGASFSPTDLVATALGSCFLTIMGLMAERHEKDLTGVCVRIEKTMAAKPLRRIAQLHVTVRFPPEVSATLDQGLRDKLERAAGHCPVHASLHPDIAVPVEFVYEA